MPKVDIDKLDRLIEVAKRLKKEQKQHDKHQEDRRAMTTMNNTPKQMENKAAKMEECSEQMERDLHKLHLAAVELGVAEPDPERYGDREMVSNSGWQTRREVRKGPQ